jgi:hypothetical protein
LLVDGVRIVRGDDPHVTPVCGLELAHGFRRLARLAIQLEAGERDPPVAHGQTRGLVDQPADAGAGEGRAEPRFIVDVSEYEIDAARRRQAHQQIAERRRLLRQLTARAVMEIAGQQDHVGTFGHQAIGGAAFEVGDAVGLDVGQHADPQRRPAGALGSHGHGVALEAKPKRLDEAGVEADRDHGAWRMPARPRRGRARRRGASSSRSGSRSRATAG